MVKPVIPFIKMVCGLGFLAADSEPNVAPERPKVVENNIPYYLVT